MCGIAGRISWEPGGVRPEALERACERMAFRGPDDRGLWIDPGRRVGLSHRRLAILDLSPAGHQPMVQEQGPYAIVLNGEVYNYRELKAELASLGHAFTSETDTEVVLKAYVQWGCDAVRRFIGMFAFAVWDGPNRALFLARDRIGVKPLYYLSDRAGFAFASRLSPLLDLTDGPRRIDREALGLYLDAGFVPAPWSMVEGVRKLPPGHSLWIQEGTVRLHAYWSPDAVQPDRSLEGAGEAELAERLDGLIRESIRMRLVSDVPLGAFLSGGIDSSTVVALMKEVSGAAPRTFTIGFDDPDLDESAPAREVARHLGTEHHERRMTGRDLLDLLPDHAMHFDEPHADWSSLPTRLVSRFARERVTVALSGDGGDELFAGYPQYRLVARLSPLLGVPRLLRRPLSGLLSAFGSGRARHLGEFLALPDRSGAFAFLRSMIRGADRAALAPRQGPALADLFRERARGFPALDPVAAACRLDLSYYLPDGLLQKLDVASMSASLEAREPLLDHRLVEFALSLPTSWKMNGGATKLLLRRVLARYLPPSLFDRPKRGFGAPLHRWFRHELKDMIQDDLSPSRLARVEPIDPLEVRRLLDLHLSGRRDTHAALWTLWSLVRWEEQILRGRGT